MRSYRADMEALIRKSGADAFGKAKASVADLRMIADAVDVLVEQRDEALSELAAMKALLRAEVPARMTVLGAGDWM